MTLKEETEYINRLLKEMERFSGKKLAPVTEAEVEAGRRCGRGWKREEQPSDESEGDFTPFNLFR